MYHQYVPIRYRGLVEVFEESKRLGKSFARILGLDNRIFQDLLARNNHFLLVLWVKTT